jgi:crotonobetainyl-CoA:carnitine CoA-transferase CaiB-like acyl-CoA transferase
VAVQPNAIGDQWPAGRQCSGVMSKAETGPLSGLRVLDFSHAAAAPFATMFLGDLGADVIKLEKLRDGDGARSMGVPMPELDRRDSDYFVALNRNKQGVSINLASSQGVDIARKLVAKSDIVVENFRPGVMDRLGLGFDQLKTLRQGLIYCSISAFGSSGPWVGRPANDIIMQSVSGLMGVTGEMGGGPVRIGVPISDFSSGLFGLSGILAALFARDRHPEGQHIEVAMIEASLSMMSNYIPSVATLGARIPRLGRGHAQIVPYQAFLCSDGEYVMVGAFTRGFWHNLCRALGHEEWMTDPRFASNPMRLKNRTELLSLLNAIFGKKPREEWLAILDKADVPNSPVLELHDAIKTEQVVHNRSLIPLTKSGVTFEVVRSPIRVAEWGPEKPPTPPPSVGEHTAEVLETLLGLSSQEIACLVEAGVVQCGPDNSDKARKA